MSEVVEHDELSGLIDMLMSGAGGENGGIFGEMDPEMLLKLLDIISKLGSQDKNTELLAALRPHLREENRAKLDRAAHLMKLIGLIPLLKDSGLADELFRHI